MKILLMITFLSVTLASNGQCGSFSLTLSKMDPTCYGFCDGSVTSVVTGANGMLYGEITDSNGIVVLNGAMGTSPNSLCPGWYFVEVEDDSGCYAMDSIYLIGPDEMIVNLIYTDPTHLDSCNGIVEVDTVLNYQGNYSNIGYYWSPGGPTGIGETIKDDLCNDFYTLVINDEFGCSITVDIASGSASVPDNMHSESISVYPNPVSDYLFIEGNLPDGTDVLVYDMTGQLSFKLQLTEGKINLSHLKSGQYIVKVLSNENIHSQQIIKY
ncbi:MAG: T9SS type A sorting domain-containing protein [Crocinitomicaceae bacterium]|nr:T9SS type A sorting domain-containing protein [Crocinitomicaceae bacterium]